VNIGDLSVKLAALSAVVAFVAAISWARGSRVFERLFRLSYLVMTLSLASASSVLMVAILRHDFSIEYVVNYSSRDLPLLYLVSAFWAGQEGTYLLWALLSAAIGYALFRKRSWEPAAVMACYLPTIGFLLLLMLNSDGNPFRLVEVVPPDGHGLNMLLQDPWMASHPPLVFLGYAAAAVPAVLALVALFKRKHEDWLTPALRWALAAFICLGSGIVLGGFWAYKVLGWGGYWGWDPVENASLIPWIVVAALLHGLLVQRASGSLRRTNLLLALAGYLLVLYSTFLTRSGVLAEFSVHSFQQGSIYRFLLGIMIFAAAASIFAFLYGRVRLGKEVVTGLSWPFVLSAAIALLGISAIIILIGTSWPIISSLAGQAAAFGPSYYNLAGLVLYTVVLVLLGAAPFLDWSSGGWRRLLTRILPSLLVAAAGTTAAGLLSDGGPGPLVLFFVALLALTSNIIRFASKIRSRPLNSGAALAHLGFALMFVGIVASSVWGVEEEASLPLGERVEVLDMELTFTGHVAESEPQDRWTIDVRSEEGDDTVAEVAIFRMASGGRQDSYMHRPAIRRGLLGDLYIAPQWLETTGGTSTLELVKERPVRLGNASFTFMHFQTEGMASGEGMTVWAHLMLQRGGEEEALVLPYIVVRDGARGEPVEPALLPGVILSLQAMSVEESAILVRVEDSSARPRQVMNVEVSTKPLINVLWAGTFLLGLGCAVALIRRWRESR
jgi:cytochrome c-type biogenesis protein CcmF